MISSTVQFFL